MASVGSRSSAFRNSTRALLLSSLVKSRDNSRPYVIHSQASKFFVAVPTRACSPSTSLTCSADTTSR